jgi:rare lipoprotein A
LGFCAWAGKPVTSKIHGTLTSVVLTLALEVGRVEEERGLMRTQKWLGQGLAPAPKLGLVSCLCVTALSWPVGLLSEARAQASARRGSAPTHATELPLENPSLSPAADLVFAPQFKASLPAKLGTLNVQDFSPQASFSPLPEEPILKIGEQRQSALQPIATLYSYAMDGRQAVTVYVRDLPIVTFIEHPRLEPPLLRASSLVAQLNQMAQGSLKDTTITLAWTEFQAGDPLYAVQVNDQELLRIDEGVLLVDNQRPVDTALLAANRLRRLLLDAPPLPAPTLPQLATLPAKAAAQPPQRTAQQDPLFTVERVQEGIASWYDLHPTRQEMTAAHPTLPFGTEVRVTNLKNGRQAVVRINDRGPFIPGRIIDLSLRAAEALGMVRAGLAPVRLEVLRRR